MSQTATHAPDAYAPARPMRQARPVVAAITGLDGADVMRAASLLASHAGAELRVVAVVEPLPLYYTGVDSVVITPLDDERERRALLLERVRKQVHDVLGADAAVTLDVQFGDPAECITSAARACGAAVIVVGIGRHRPVDRLLGSETALRVVRLADRPVLAVARRLDTLPSHVVVASDFSPSSVRAAELALPFLDEHATVTFVHAWQRAPITSPWVAATEDAYARAIPSALDRVARAIDAPAALTLRTAALEGPTAVQVLDFARTREADLVVVGRRSHSWVDRLFVGSVATAVLRGATCAVLVTPDPDATEKDRLRRLVAGLSEGDAPAEWVAQLDGFSRRNRGRVVTVEEDDPTVGAQTLVTALPLLGAAYDPHDKRVELMLGEAGTSGRRMMHSVGQVHTVATLTDDERVDTALCIRHGTGQTLLTFVTTPRDPRTVPPTAVPASGPAR